MTVIPENARIFSMVDNSFPVMHSLPQKRIPIRVFPKRYQVPHDSDALEFLCFLMIVFFTYAHTIAFAGCQFWDLQQPFFRNKLTENCRSLVTHIALISSHLLRMEAALEINSKRRASFALYGIPVMGICNGDPSLTAQNPHYLQRHDTFNILSPALTAASPMVRQKEWSDRLRRHLLNGRDVNETFNTLLELRNKRLAAVGISPTRRMLKRRTQMALPIRAGLLELEVRSPLSRKENCKTLGDARISHNQTSKLLWPLAPNDSMISTNPKQKSRRYEAHQKDRTWYDSHTIR